MKMRARPGLFLPLAPLLAALAAAPSGRGAEPQQNAPGRSPAGPEATAAAPPGRARSATEKLARELYQELVDTDTTHESGSTTRAAELVAKRLRREGFPAQDVQVLGPAPSQGNLVARLRGKNPGRKPLLLMAHLDVVAADAKDWSVDPFKLLERDGYFWGRGSVDDKDEAAIHVANLIRMKREGFVPERDIVVALTADEEAGPNNGIAWLLAEHRAWLDAALALNEGGGGELRDGQRTANEVQASEKIYQDFELEVTDPGGHSSRPRPENAIYRLADALQRIRSYEFPVQLNEVTRAFFERSAAQQPPELAAAMRGAARTPPDPDALARLTAIPNQAARLRTTCVATQVEAGHARNALPQRARANVNCRILPDSTPAEVETTLRRVIADERVALRREDDAHSRASPPSPLTPGVLAAIEKTTNELWPGVPVIPTMGTGATDGLFLRSAGIPVYGVSGIFLDPDDARAHGKDERAGVEAFYEGLEFLYRLSTRLAQMTDAELGLKASAE